MIGSNGKEIFPDGKPWETKPMRVDGSNFRDLTDKEIETLSVEELCYIGMSLSNQLPDKKEYLIKIIIAEKNKVA